MSIEKGASICLKAKICLKCHGPSYIWKLKDHNHSCPINQSRKAEKLEKFKEEYRSKYKLNFGLFLNVNAAVKSKKVNPPKNKKNSDKTLINEPIDFITSKEATETLRKKLSEGGEEPRLKEIPEGRSIF